MSDTGMTLNKAAGLSPLAPLKKTGAQGRPFIHGCEPAYYSVTAISLSWLSASESALTGAAAAAFSGAAGSQAS